MTAINIAFICDSSQSCYLASAIASICSNADTTDLLRFYIVDAGLTSQDRQLIEGIQKIKEFSLTFLWLTPEMLGILEKMPSPSNPPIVYARFFLAELLPNLDKVLYLDADLLVQKSLSPLYHGTDVSKHAFAATPIPFAWKNANSRLGLPLDFPYFSAGILLVNLDYWRRFSIAEKLVSFSKKHAKRFIMQDQDALNVFFKQDYVTIEEKWNKKPAIHNDGEPCNIVHFMGKGKMFTKMSYLLHYYIAMTGYGNFPAQYYKEDGAYFSEYCTDEFWQIFEEHMHSYLKNTPIETLRTTYLDAATRLPEQAHQQYLKNKGEELSGQDVYFWGCGKAYEANKHYFSGCRPVYILLDRVGHGKKRPKQIDQIAVKLPSQVLGRGPQLPLIIFSRNLHVPIFRAKIQKRHSAYPREKIVFVVS